MLVSISPALQGHVAAARAAAPESPAAAATAAAAKAVARAPAPQPAQPTPVVKTEPAHKKLESYLPGELCEAFRTAGLKHDLYDWQVMLITFGSDMRKHERSLAESKLQSQTFAPLLPNLWGVRINDPLGRYVGSVWVRTRVTLVYMAFGG